MTTHYTPKTKLTATVKNARLGLGFPDDRTARTEAMLAKPGLELLDTLLHTVSACGLHYCMLFGSMYSQCGFSLGSDSTTDVHIGIDCRFRSDQGRKSIGHGTNSASKLASIVLACTASELMITKSAELWSATSPTDKTQLR